MGDNDLRMENEPEIANNNYGFEQNDGWDETLAEINPVIIRPPAPNWNEYVYKDIAIKFPYKAYVSQQLMMDKIIGGLTTGENCLLESPTGTGKTAALLCALLGWQEHCSKNNDNCKSIIEASAEKFGGCTCGLINDKDKTFVHMQLDKRNQEWSLIGYTYYYDYQEDGSSTGDSVSIINGSTTINSSTPRQGSTPTSTPTKNCVTSATLNSKCPTTPNATNSMSNLPGTISSGSSPAKKQRLHETLKCNYTERTLETACRYCIKKYVYNRSKPPKIYYCTRTHSQISQVVKQLKSTAYANAKMTILASRFPTCISDEAMNAVRELNNEDDAKGQTINDVCREWKRNYFFRKKQEEQSEELLTPVVEVEVKEEGQDGPKLPPICSYFAPNDVLKARFEDFQENGAFDFEDIKEQGRCSVACPYFGSQLMHNEADIVFGSYNYLIDPSLRDGQKIKHINAILVFDEAHNIEDICRNAFSFTFDVEVFRKDVLGLVTGLLDKLEEPNQAFVGPSKIHALQKLDQIFNSWIDCITKRGNKLLPPPSQYRHKLDFKEGFVDQILLDFLKEVKMDKEHIEICLELANEAGDLNPDKEECVKDYYINWRGIEKPFKLSSRVSEYLKGMKQSLDYLYEEEQEDGIGGAKDFKGYLTACLKPTSNIVKQRDLNTTIFNPNKPKFEVNCIFQIICLNPAIGFRELRNTAYSIIVASGTLTPLNSFASELCTKFSITLQADHVIPSSNVWAGVISVGPENVNLSLTKDQQDDPHVQDEIGRIVSEICETIPNGVLVFLPSYALMSKLKTRWQTYPMGNSIFKRIERKKLVYFEESQDKNLFKRQMEKYKQDVLGGLTWNGCILFAVFRGKISEGIDFADEQARCVVTIGIPFSSIVSADIVSKKEYNNMRKRNQKPGEQYLSGPEWYKTHAFRAMNQAFGRCVRHRDDWGALVLIDSRMGRRENGPYISGWVKKGLKEYNNFNDVKDKLNLFLRARCKQDKFRKTIKIQYEPESPQKSNFLDETEVIMQSHSEDGNVNDSEGIATQVVAEANGFLDDLLTQQMDVLSPPVATSTPQSSQTQVERRGESSPEYSFSEEMEQVMGSQSTQRIVIDNEDNSSPANQVDNQSGDSSPSVYGRSPANSSDEEMSRVLSAVERRQECSNNDNHVLDVSMPSVNENMSQGSSISYHSSDYES